MLGAFAGVRPLRISTPPTMSFAELTGAVAGKQWEMLRHQRFPLGHLTRELGHVEEKSALFDIGFNYLQIKSDLNFEGGGSNLIYLSHHRETTPMMVTALNYP